MPSQWQATGSTPLTITAPAGAGGQVIRLRALQVQAAAAVLTVADSTSGTVFSVTPPVGLVALSNLDIRATGANMVITNAGATGNISAQGDYVPIGYPYGQG